VKTQSGPIVAVFLIVLLALASCGTREPSPPASGVAPGQAIQGEAAPAGNTVRSTPPQGALRPANVAEQLTFLPGRAGGGSISDCFDYQRYKDKPNQTDFYTTKAELNIGDALSICYYNYQVSSVAEQIIDESGKIVRTLNFTIDTVEQGKILDATDFTAMPGMAQGVYRVVTQFPDHTEELSFRLTGQLVKSDGSSLRVLSSGPKAAATDAFEFIILDTFAPKDKVTLAFFTPCSVSDERLAEVPEGDRYTLSLATQYVFVTAAQVQVDDAGWAVIPVPDQLRKQLDPARSYLVKTYPTTGDNADQGGNGAESKFAYAEARLRGAGEASDIACPYVRAP
jgi:hypothetical protein